MVEINRIICEKCKVKHTEGIMITKIYGMWLCGKCLNTYINKMDEQKRRLLLEE
jgi:hypothetical protein